MAHDKLSSTAEGRLYSQELRSTGDSSPRARSNTLSELTSDERDRIDLLRLGKLPVLKRDFGFMSIIGFSTSILVTWESFLSVFDQSFENGGPAGSVYGFIFVWFGIWSVYASLCELASMAPTSGGQYFWVSMLSPPSTQRFLSYITGWLTVCGWQAATASVSYLAGSLIQGLIILTVPSYTPHPYHATLLLWATLLYAVTLNAFGRRFLPKFEGFLLMFHVLGFFAVLIPLAILGSHIEPAEVFERFLNEGGWPTQGLSFFIGIIGPVFCFTGVDGAVHMAEEIKGASMVVPRAIMASLALNGMLGFGIMMAINFTLGDVEGALHTPTGFPFMEIFRQATNSTHGAAFMASVITIMQMSATVGVLASASRMLWSFCRDRGVPWWRFLSKVHPQLLLPLRCVATSTLIATLLSLIDFGSSKAFNDIVSIAVACLNSSYILTLGLLLWRRLTGSINPTNCSDTRIVSSTRSQLTWGPWRIPGMLGIANNLVACVYMLIVWFFSFWPSSTPPGSQEMNYSCLVFAFIVGVATISYFVHGRREYRGPVNEAE